MTEDQLHKLLEKLDEIKRAIWGRDILPTVEKIETDIQDIKTEIASMEKLLQQALEKDGKAGEKSK